MAKDISQQIARAIERYYQLTRVSDEEYDKHDVKLVAELADVPVRTVYEYLNS